MGVAIGGLPPRSENIRDPKKALKVLEEEFEGFAGTDRYASLIKSMAWKLERAPSGLFFVTSDQPVCTRRRGRDLNESIVGLARKDLDVELSFPLARNVMLLAAWSHGRQSRRQTKSTPARVLELNRRSVLSAHRFVYSPCQCGTIEALLETHAKFRLRYE